jgi:hypothetical protein
MISLALLGFFQALFLPGLVLCLWVNKGRTLRLPDVIIIITPISILLNYIVVAVLTWGSLYTQNFIHVALAVEIGLCFLYVYRHGHSISHHSGLTRTHESNFERRNRQILQYVALLYLLSSYAPVIGTAIWYSDAAVSWNRWAQDWFDQVPKGSLGYPPALPILYSIVYKSANTTDIQVIAKLVAGYFPFYGLLCIWRIGHVAKDLKWISLVAGIFYAFLLTRGYAENDNFAFQGFADPIIASLAAYCLFVMVYCSKLFMRKGAGGTADWPNVLTLCIGLAAPALIKQNGVVLCMLSLCLVNLSYIKNYKKLPIKVIVGSIIVFVIAIHWYIFSYFFYSDFVRAVDLLESNIFNRILKALQLTIYVSRPWISILFVVGVLLYSKARIHFVIFLLPLWLFWAILVSYDYRTAYMIIPSIAFIAAAGMEGLVVGWQRVEAKYHLKIDHLINFLSHAKVGNFLVASVFLLFLFALPFVYADMEFAKYARERRITSGDTGNNRYLSDLFEKTNEKSKVIACVDNLWSLPGARNSLVVTYPCKAAKLQWLNDDSIKYLYLQVPATEPFEPDWHRSDEVFRELTVQFKEFRLKGDYYLFQKCPCPD